MIRCLRALPLWLAAFPALADAPTGHMDHAAMSGTGGTYALTQPGQSAFAAIEEIVAVLKADPATDWTRVDIAALQSHLADMERVFTQAQATVADTDTGVSFTVTGTPEVAASIRAMTAAHVSVVQGTDGWRYDLSDVPQGVVLTVEAPDRDRAKLRGLGFFGLMALGGHHQAHHWALATGNDPHRQP
jgi:hypothetical protein